MKKNNKNLVTINLEKKEIEIPIISYKDQRVLTFDLIDSIHDKIKGTAKKDFFKNKKHFINNRNYFLVKHSEIKSNYELLLGINAPKRGLIFINEEGYLLLVKLFKDDLAWEIQKKLVNSYFQLKEINDRVKAKESIKDFEWLKKRDETKIMRRSLTDTIKLFELYAEKQGSHSPNLYYLHFTKLVNKEIFNVKNATKFKKILGNQVRDKLDVIQMSQLITIEDYISREIINLIQQKFYYKDIYNSIRADIILLTNLLGAEIPRLLTADEIEVTKPALITNRKQHKALVNSQDYLDLFEERESSQIENNGVENGI